MQELRQQQRKNQQYSSNADAAQKLRALMKAEAEVDEEDTVVDRIKLGEDGWKQRYYEITFGIDSNDRDFKER